MIQTTLLKILVTVMVLGKPPIVELLPTEYAVTSDKCDREAQALLSHVKVSKGVKVSAKCVLAQTRGA